MEKEHDDWLEAQYAPQKAAYEEVLAKYSGTGKTEAYEAEQEWLEKERALLTRIENWDEDTRQKLQTLLDGAYLMPFETREKAKAYLESMQKDFHAGGFFAKKKKPKKQENSGSMISMPPSKPIPKHKSTGISARWRKKL